MPPKLFFFHNPKAGGTSLSEWLATSFPEAERAPLIVNDGDRHRELGGQYAMFRGYSFYSGHYGRDIFQSVADGHAPITNFRDPVRRLVSLYNFFRLVVPDSEEVLTHPRFACVQAAKRMTIENFLLSDDVAITLYTRNYHVRQLTRSGFEPDADIEIAIQMLNAMPWYFVSEDVEASVRWAEEWLQTTLPALPRSNVTPAHPERVFKIDDDLKMRVRQRNELDYRLYDIARTRLSAWSGKDVGELAEI